MSTMRTLDDHDEVLTEIGAVLREPALVVLPTDTVYGVVADAFDPRATASLRSAKRLAPTAPLTVVVRTPRQAAALAADVPEAADRLMASYWPGPLTLVLPVNEDLAWDIGALAVVAVRMPAEVTLLDVVADVGPLVCSSAARPGDPSPTTVAAARDALGDAVELYVDDGPRDGEVSTVVDLTRDHAVVLREGAVPAADVELVAAGRVDWGDVPSP
ncbi:MAG TPA: L-threonylcarbamoyladenylate synthase [Euzebyales bacterium]